MVCIKVGIIGLGEVTQVIHPPILKALSDQIEIAAICDVSPGWLQVVGDLYGKPVPRRYDDASALARQPDLDSIFVLNSDEYHADYVIAAARSGNHVLVERPMCLTVYERRVVRPTFTNPYTHEIEHFRKVVTRASYRKQPPRTSWTTGA